MTEVYVINLARRPDRRERIGNRLASAGMHPLWIDALDAATMASVPPGTLTTKPHCACWLSHVRFLAAVADSGGPFAVVFEDDAVPSTAVQWPQFLERLPAAMEELNLGYLQLGHVSHFFQGSKPIKRCMRAFVEHVRNLRGGKRTIPVRLDGRRRRVLVGRSRPGTHCYAVTRRFAEQARHLNQPVFAAADDFYERLASALRQGSEFRMGTLVPGIAEQESRLARCSVIDSDVG